MSRTPTEKVKRHPVGALLMRAAHGDTVYGDEIEDLRLGERQRKAFDQALKRIETDRSGYRDQNGNQAPVSGDPVERINRALEYAGAVIQSLPADWEDRQTFNQRRAGMGDAKALAEVKAASEGYSHLAEQVEASAGSV